MLGYGSNNSRMAGFESLTAKLVVRTQNHKSIDPYYIRSILLGVLANNIFAIVPLMFLPRKIY